VLLGGPSTTESRRVAGYLAKLGYDADIAVTGRDVLRMGFESPDYEMIFLDAGIDQPPVDFLLQQLRHDGRTADLPVGVLARADLLDRARHAVRNDARADAFSRPHAEEDVRWQVDRLLALAGQDRLPFAERQRQAARALELLAEVNRRPGAGGVADSSGAEKAALTALQTPGLVSPAVALLGDLGTAEGQRELVEVASRSTEPLAVRQAAVEAFLHSTERYGILLTTDQIRRQYDRYNQSAALDAATQQVLGRILDILETPARAKAAPQPAPVKAAGGKGS
jgi:hypothetical protein